MKIRNKQVHLFLPASPLSATVLQELDLDSDKVGLHYDGGFRDFLIEQIAWTVHREMTDPAPAGKLLVETLAAALAVHIMRRYSNLQLAATPLPSARGALDARRLQRVTDFIDTHLGEDLTIAMLANEACLSPFHFARAFKAATGAAPHRYLTDRRIDRARRLIEEGRLPLAEIAELCGPLMHVAPVARFGHHILSLRLGWSKGYDVHCSFAYPEPSDETTPR